MRFCPWCGTENVSDAAFCQRCGRVLPSAVAPAGGSASSEDARQPAGFARRLSAWVIDLAVVLVLVLALGGATGLDSGMHAGERDLPQTATRETVSFEIVPTPLNIIGGFVYYLASNILGWTPAKRSLGMRIVLADGRRPGLLHGTGRTLASYLSAIPLYLGYLWAAWDGEKQTWHDKLARTHVVRHDRGRSEDRDASRTA